MQGVLWKGGMLMQNKSKNWIKLIGVAGAALGLVSTLISNYATSKELEETVKEEVGKALAEKESY